MNKLTKNDKKKRPSPLRIALPIILIAVMLLTTSVVFAADPSAENIIKEIVDVLFTIARYIGIILLAWGMISLALAFKNEDADSKSRSVLLIVVAIALIALKTLFWGLIDKFV